jgi:hypothetical protein
VDDRGWADCAVGGTGEVQIGGAVSVPGDGVGGADRIRTHTDAGPPAMMAAKSDAMNALRYLLTYIRNLVIINNFHEVLMS